MLRNVFVGLAAAVLVGTTFIPDEAFAYRGGGARAGGGVRVAGVRGGAVGVAGRGVAYRGAGVYGGRYAGGYYGRGYYGHPVARGAAVAAGLRQLPQPDGA